MNLPRKHKDSELKILNSNPNFWPAISAIASLGTLAVTIIMAAPIYLSAGIGLLGTGITGTLLRYRNKTITVKKRVFLSIPMTHLDNEEYTRLRKKVMLLIHELRAEDLKVYFYNEFIIDQDDFKEDKFDVNIYLDKIHRCDLFVAVFPDRLPTSVIAEIAYAYANDKICAVFTPDRKLLPLLIRHICDHPGMDIRNWDGFEKISAVKNYIISKLKKDHKDGSLSKY